MRGRKRMAPERRRRAFAARFFDSRGFVGKPASAFSPTQRAGAAEWSAAATAAAPSFPTASAAPSRRRFLRGSLHRRRGRRREFDFAEKRSELSSSGRVFCRRRTQRRLLVHADSGVPLKSKQQRLRRRPATRRRPAAAGRRGGGGSGTPVAFTTTTPPTTTRLLAFPRGSGGGRRLLCTAAASPPSAAAAAVGSVSATTTTPPP